MTDIRDPSKLVVGQVRVDGSAEWKVLCIHQLAVWLCTPDGQTFEDTVAHVLTLPLKLVVPKLDFDLYPWETHIICQNGVWHCRDENNDMTMTVPEKLAPEAEPNGTYYTRAELMARRTEKPEEKINDRG